jgi:hypothetical protein
LTASRGRIALATISAVAIVFGIAGCGSGDGNPAAGLAGGGLVARAAPGDCPEAVLEAFGDIAARVYHEGVSSERTVVAQRLIARSTALRQAVERGDAAGTRSAAESLIATGHLTNLIVSRAGGAAATPGSAPATSSQVLADTGAPGAVAPVRGTLTGASGATIGNFITSVWSNSGILAETNGIAEGVTALRERGRSVGGSFALPSGELPAQGTLMRGGIAYQYTSFPAEAYPSGSLRVFVLKPVSSTTSLCGRTNQDTVVNTLQRVARRIYTAEAGRRTLPQIRRVQQDPALRSAIARRDPAATRAAMERLLAEHVHISRLRVSAGGRLLADVGGPFVLAPVHGSLRQGGRTIGSFVLSIQDDEGYLRLAKRLAGLDVLMYMGPRLVKNSLGPSPGRVPATGYYDYRGRTFRVFSFNASAFPSGPLRIVVLAPIAQT